MEFLYNGNMYNLYVPFFLLCCISCLDADPQDDQKTPGRNTLHPYKSNPENLLLKEDDILFIDFGPVFEDWEADFGRTYVKGPKLKLNQHSTSELFDF